MKKSVSIKRSVFVPPKYIDSNIMKNVFSILKNKYEKTCDEEDGLILSIDNIIKVENMVSKDSCYVQFDLTFLATVIKPEKGMKLAVKPSYILATKGIFSKLYDNINVFVPEVNIKEWKYSNDSYTKSDRVIDKDTVINVIVNDIKFNSTKYNCVCSLSD